jgi:hypothetical protein
MQVLTTARSALEEQARHTREQEMQALENRWLAQHSADAREQQRVASALSADAEMLREEAVQSVVQHLSAFGLNRNLPWQIYATRPKRFTRGPLGREPLGREPLGPLGAPSLSSLSAARLALGEPMGAQDDVVPPLLHPLDPYAGQNAGQNPYALFDAPPHDERAAPAAVPPPPHRPIRSTVGSVYDQPVWPRHQPPRTAAQHSAEMPLPPVRGAKPRTAWPSPRVPAPPQPPQPPQHKKYDYFDKFDKFGRPISPRSLAPPSAYA